MKKKSFLPVILFIFLITNTSMSQNEQESTSLEGLEWITGLWQSELSNGKYYERWTASDENSMIGEAFIVKGGDTIPSEELKIQVMSDGIYYIAIPRNQEETHFKLVSLEGQEAVFENLEHDFPQRIIYRGNPDGGMYVEAAVIDKEDGKKLVFNFTKIEE